MLALTYEDIDFETMKIKKSLMSNVKNRGNNSDKRLQITV